MLNYLSSSIPVGNTVFGLTNLVTCSLRGFTFIGDRFALLLVKSGSSLYWKKIDTYTDTVATYSMPYTPANAGMDAADQHESDAGQFLTADDTYMYYLNGNSVMRIAINDGAAAGSHILRTSSMSAIPANALGAVSIKGSNLYVTSKSQQTTYLYNTGVWAWDGSAQNAVRQVSIPELATYELSGTFCQPGSDNDFVLLLKQGSTATSAIKYTPDLVTRKGISDCSDPSVNMHGTQFKGSILYIAHNDPSVAGSGVILHRFGDGSTGVVAKERTVLSLSNERVKAGSGALVKITFIARDGYGLNFPVSEKVRFSLVKVGDSFDKNDGALAATSDGPWRNSSDEPVSVTLDAPFDIQGKAECWWQAPIEVPVDVLMHRIKVEYPIFS